MGEVVGERDGCFLVCCLHVLHLCCGVEERVLLRRDGHVDLRQILGVSEVLVHVSGLDIQSLQRIERCVSLFGSRVGLYRLAIRRDSLVVLSEVAIEHRALQRSLARYRRMRVRREQLLVGHDCPALVVLLQLRTGDLIDAVIGVVGLGKAFYQVAQHADLLIVLMLQTKRVTSLEEGIIGTRRLKVSHLRIIRDGLRELTGIEIAVADSVERVGVGRFGSQGSIQIDGEGLSCPVIIGHGEIGVTLQIPGDGVVLRALCVGAREEGIQILGALFVVA